jgi:ubiquinone/menaquinone biosynthesis C-methylase UbiE
MDMIDVRGSRDAIRRAYDLFSVFYGFVVSPVERRAIARGIARAQVRPGERVLEVAVGAGAAFERLREQAGEAGLAVGLDLAPRMLSVTRRRVPGALLVRADARSLPFPDGSFDLVFASYFLDLIPTAELVPMLRGFLETLRPGGRLVLVDFSREGDRLTWWERLYVRTPAWLVPYVFGSCRPIRAAPFLREAGFAGIEREFMTGGFSSEIIVARKAPTGAGIREAPTSLSG